MSDDEAMEFGIRHEMAMVADASMPCYAVQRAKRWSSAGVEEWETLSAWTDIYAAKYEAARWEQDSKVPHRYVTATLVLLPGKVIS